METILTILIILFNSVLWAALRRIFGGAIKKGILGNRGMQTILMIVSMFPFVLYPLGLPLWVILVIALITSCWVQFCFWSKGHGPCFDIANDKDPSEDTIRRYKEMFGYNYLCKRIPYPRWYGFLFDYRLMNIRYNWPMLPLTLLVSPLYILIGLAISPIYAFCWALWREERWLFDLFPSWLKKPVQLAEIIGGFIFGFGISSICIYLHGGLYKWLEFIATLPSMM